MPGLHAGARLPLLRLGDQTVTVVQQAVVAIDNAGRESYRDKRPAP
jgi:hypothetical protein